MVPRTSRPPTLAAVRRRLHELGDADDTAFLQRFFKTAPGQYGAGDRFLGIRVPVTRKLSREFRHLPLTDIEDLLHEPWHEARLLGVVLLADRYEAATEKERTQIYRLYLRNTDRVNNWDLVDSSAPEIVGGHLLERPRAILDKLARSKNLWERRIIHKATGWMLREVGKRDPKQLDAFLDEHAHEMPRTALRYAIERMPVTKRRQYMSAKRRNV